MDASRKATSFKFNCSAQDAHCVWISGTPRIHGRIRRTHHETAHICISAPTSVSDDDDGDDDADDAEEEDSVDRTIGCSWDGTRLRSIKRVKGAMTLDLDLDSDSEWETELERIRIRAWTRHHALPVRHAPAYTQERLAVVPVTRRVWPVPIRMQGEVRICRLLGHGRALSTDRAATAI